MPDGFYVSEDGKTVEEGLVVIAPDGSEFVWIPVEIPVVEYNGNYPVTAGEFLALNTFIIDIVNNDKKFPMAIHFADGNYKGVLYSFSGTDTLTLTVSEYKSDGSSYREPDILTHATRGDTNDNLHTYYKEGMTQTDFKIELQTEYNKMVKSVKENGGFYIGRYETSMRTEDIVQSKAEVMPMSADPNSGNQWWGMYAKQKAYASDNNITGISSSMIWGSQRYQAMLFINGKKDGAGASYYVASFLNTRSRAYVEVTGNNINDKVANIYDLQNNVSEFTQEAYGGSGRVGAASTNTMGGAAYRGLTIPDATYGEVGSRMQLYIK